MEKMYQYVSPYMENGDLLEAIQNGRSKENTPLPIKTRLRILYQIASAIDYLHTPQSHR